MLGICFSGGLRDEMEELDKQILKRIDERNQIYKLLVSKKSLELRLKVEIQNLEADISNLDNNIFALSKKPYFEK